ncbi:SRPBCC family protein [Demequina litorisediminis]|uniref:SRPBCC family protein n=1 Tax=Demequina litorisediminis TaxID=1849022 RepID=UPI0032AF2138
MSGPDGEHSGGFWEFLAVDPGRSFEVRDGFATEDGNENAEMPSMRMTFQFEETENGSRLVTTTHFNSAEELEQAARHGHGGRHDVCHGPDRRRARRPHLLRRRPGHGIADPVGHADSCVARDPGLRGAGVAGPPRARAHEALAAGPRRVDHDRGRARA